LNYPPTHFTTFLSSAHLLPHIKSTLLTIFSLLTRLTANSTTSGHTPPSLSPLFGPLIFGLGPVNKVGFYATYMSYIRVVEATEHLLLGFIRWQDSAASGTSPGIGAGGPGLGPGARAALAVPQRLKEWIKDYPAKLPFIQNPASSQAYGESGSGSIQPRKGARTVRVTTVRRNVRMYATDLVRSGAGWAYKSRFYTHAAQQHQQRSSHAGGLADSKVWARICPPAPTPKQRNGTPNVGLGSGSDKDKMPPRYSDQYKKRLGLGAGIVPEFGPWSSSTGSLSPSSSLSSSTSSWMSDALSSTTTLGEGMPGSGTFDYFNINSTPLTLTLSGSGGPHSTLSAGDKDRFRSLTDLKWGEFEKMGFGGLGSDGGGGGGIGGVGLGEKKSKLDFDLTEGARTVSTIFSFLFYIFMNFLFIFLNSNFFWLVVLVY
jgi:hypothetical protein